MSVVRSIRGLCLGLIATAVVLLTPASVLAVAPAPSWAPIAVNGPTNLPPGGSGQIAVYAQNIGGLASSGTVTIKDELPAGLLTAGPAFPASGLADTWTCPGGAGQSEVTCTSTGNIAPGGGSASVGPGVAAVPIIIPVEVVTATQGTLVNEVSVSGGGAQGTAVYEGPVTISATPAEPGFQAFTAGAYNADGTPATQAGSHPYSAPAAIFVNTIKLPSGQILPAGDPKTIGVEIPPGFLGNPIAVPACLEGTKDDDCSITSQVGMAQVITTGFGGVGALSIAPSPVHNIEAPVGYPAKFTFEAANIFPVNAVGSLRSDKDYGITVESPNTAQIRSVFGVFFTFWGSPADASHDAQRCISVEPAVGCGPGAAEETAFLTMPTGCGFQAEQLAAKTGPFAILKFDTWLTVGQFNVSEFPVPTVGGCDQLEFEADFTFEPSDTKADSPASFRTELSIPSEGLTDPDKLTTPEIRKSVVQLPEGVTLNPSAADGLGACTEEQIGLINQLDPATGLPIPLAMPNPIRFNRDANKCPESSKIGTGELKSELIEEPLQGALYLAAQGKGNPFGSLFAVYLVIEDPRHGIFIKLPGEVEPDSRTGQFRVSFDNLPQLPFTYLRLNLKGGNRSALASPTTCGSYVTTSINTPWSAPESGPPTVSANGFEINQGPNGMACANTPAERPFEIGWKAGAESAQAGASGPFRFNLVRPDGSQELVGLSLKTPQGLSASLKGVSQCSPAQIAQAEQSTGKAEQASSACPAASQVGTLTTGAGAGPTPFYASGKLYLAGPYKGAPLSVVAITPAVAGPFDLGNVVVRNAVKIDRGTAQVLATSDEIPQILKGVALRIRDVRIKLDREDWTINPTNCEASSVELTARGASGAVAERSARFQVGGCSDLGFAPKLTAKVIGGTKRGKHPAFEAKLTYPEGSYANIKDVQVSLPHSEFLDQAHIRTICTRPQAAAQQCPPGSIYGFAEATTPLLDGKLTGPVFLKSSSNKLPDLAIFLKGPDSQPVEVEFQGRVDSIKGQIRNTIEGLPDVPVSSFTLKMKGGKKGLLINSRDLCKGKPGRMTVRMVGQNNKVRETRPALGNGCGKKGKGAGKRRQARRRHAALSFPWGLF